MGSREELIDKYFHEGYKYEEIREILAQNNYPVSLGHLKVLIKNMGLKRKYLEEDIDEITLAIVTELEGSGQCLGYKSMWPRLKYHYGLEVQRATVLDLMRILDPEGIEERSRYRLKRREYKSLGPMYILHMDGYDKITPYGFCIHGCIDGHSRKIMWLMTATTNHKPEVVASYYLKLVKKLKQVPAIVRSDHGTENNLVELLQITFRSQNDDALAGEKSFMRGKSTANQRIESLSGQLRKQCVQFWMSFFKDMVEEKLFNRKDPIQLECLRFCFGPVITIELEKFKKEWNRHFIRKQQGDVLAGKPNQLFYVPESYGFVNCGKMIEDEHVNRAILHYTTEPTNCDPKFNELVELLIPDLVMPTTAVECKTLYIRILNLLDAYEE